MVCAENLRATYFTRESDLPRADRRRFLGQAAAISPPRAARRLGASERTPSAQMHSLRSCSGPADPLVGFFKSSSARFQIGMGEQRLKKSRVTI
jgi:hypothetical protein